MLKLMAFDVDGTLAPYLENPEDYTVKMLREFQKRARLALISGKNVSYLQGFARALGLLKGAVLMGENGLVIDDDGELKSHKLLERPAAFAELERAVQDKFGDGVYIQINTVAVAVFVKNFDDTDNVRAYMNTFPVMHDPNVTVYFHPDRCTELIPAGCDKGAGLDFYMKKNAIAQSEVLAAGDGMNDIEMLKKACVRLIVGDKIDCPGALHFACTRDMLDAAALQLDKN